MIRMNGPVAALLALASCSGSDEAGVGAMAMGPALVASPIVARGPAATGPVTELYRVTDIDLIGDSLAIVDNGNDRIVLLNEKMEFVWASGRAGSGPGEFEMPATVRAAPHGLTAIDYRNVRYTELDRAGAFIRTVSAPLVATTFGIRSDGSIVSPARLETHYAYIVTADSAAVPFAARDTVDLPSDMFGQRDRPPLVAVTTGDTVHIFDDVSFQLKKFDSAGHLLLRRSLPVAFTDSLREDMERSVSALERRGYRVVGVTRSRTLKATTDGRLLLLISIGVTAGFVIDPHTYEAQRIVAPQKTTEWSPLTGASNGVLQGDRLTVVDNDSLYVYQLRVEHSP